MPEHKGGNIIHLNKDDTIGGTDGQTMKGPQDVRAYEFPDYNLLQLQGINTENQDVKMEVEVQGGTIDAFVKKYS